MSEEKAPYGPEQPRPSAPKQYSDAASKIILAIKSLDTELTGSKFFLKNRIKGTAESLTQRLSSMEAELSTIKEEGLSEDADTNVNAAIYDDTSLLSRIQDSDNSLYSRISTENLTKLTEMVSENMILKSRVQEMDAKIDNVALSLQTNLAGEATNRQLAIQALKNAVPQAKADIPVDNNLLLQTIQQLTFRVEQLEKQNSELSHKLDQGLYREQSHREKAVTSLGARLDVIG
jgi:chemotaxis protein histidine kinase CheA